MLCDFLSEARLDAMGVFGYSDEDGTRGGRRGRAQQDEIRERLAHVTALAEEFTAQRAEERLGEEVLVLVESLEDAASRNRPPTRSRRSTDPPGWRGLSGGVEVGDMISARVIGSGATTFVAVARPPGRSNVTEQKTVSNWNVPNALTTLRIVMVPFFAWVLLHDGGSGPRPGGGWRSCCSAER